MSVQKPATAASLRAICWREIEALRRANWGGGDRHAPASNSDAETAARVPGGGRWGAAAPPSRTASSNARANWRMLRRDREASRSTRGRGGRFDTRQMRAGIAGGATEIGGGSHGPGGVVLDGPGTFFSAASSYSAMRKDPAAG